MPLSIASPTMCHIATGAAAETAASASTTERRRRRPSVYRQSREQARALRSHAASASSPNSSANGPPARIRSSGRPCSTILPVAEHDRAVGDEDGREPLAGDEHGPPGDRGAEVLDQVALGLGVDRRHRVVEHEHARAGDERARERDPLALAAREVDAALADQRVVAVRQVVDELGDAGRLARVEHVRPVRVRAAPRAGCRGAARRTARPSA